MLRLARKTGAVPKPCPAPASVVVPFRVPLPVAVTKFEVIPSIIGAGGGSLNPLGGPKIAAEGSVGQATLLGLQPATGRFSPP